MNPLTSKASKPQIIQSSVFADYARYYDLLYRDKDYAAEAEYVAGLIRKFHTSAKSILELGSGTGKHALLLTRKGFEVHGVEISEEMINIARSNLSNPPILKSSDSVSFDSANPPNLQSSNPLFSHGDIRHIRLGRKFDVVISLFHVISYQTTNDDVTAAFKTAKAHLNPGGIFIFDVWYGPAVLTDRPVVRIKRMADDEIEVTRLAEPAMRPDENLVEVNYHVFIRNKATEAVKELREKHAMRYFFRPEIELFAAQTGFKVVDAEEWLSGKAPGEDTWGVCFVMK
jgi:SAM-dependent methyltransferase